MHTVDIDRDCGTPGIALFSTVDFSVSTSPPTALLSFTEEYGTSITATMHMACFGVAGFAIKSIFMQRDQFVR
jgi:hypothetical protein